MCELGRLHCSIFLCFFSAHVLLFSTILLMDAATWGSSVHQFLFAKSHLGNVAWLHLSFEYWLPGLQVTYFPSEPEKQRKGRIPMEDCDEFSICWVFPPPQRMLQVMQVESTRPQSDNTQILLLLGWRCRVSKYLHYDPSEPAATERSLCTGMVWDLLAEGCFKQHGCNMLYARLYTFLGQLSRMWINLGCMYKTPYNMGSEQPGDCMALPLYTGSLKGFLQAQVSPSIPVSTCADQFLLYTGEIIS